MTTSTVYLSIENVQCHDTVSDTITCYGVVTMESNGSIMAPYATSLRFQLSTQDLQFVQIQMFCTCVAPETSICCTVIYLCLSSFISTQIAQVAKPIRIALARQLEQSKQP